MLLSQVTRVRFFPSPHLYASLNSIGWTPFGREADLNMKKHQDMKKKHSTYCHQHLIYLLSRWMSIHVNVQGHCTINYVTFVLKPCTS